MSKYNRSEEDAWEELDSFYAENPHHNGGYGKDDLFMEGEEEEYLDNFVIEMENEDGSVTQFEMIARLTDMDKDYVVLFPLSDNPDGCAVCLRLTESSDGSAMFSNIDDEEERKRVQEQFRELMEDDPDGVEIEGGGVQWQD